MVRTLSLLVTLLVLAFVIMKLMGGSGSQPGAATTARVDEQRAQQAAEQVMAAARSQDNALNSAEGRATSVAGQPGNSQQDPDAGQ